MRITPHINGARVAGWMLIAFLVTAVMIVARSRTTSTRDIEQAHGLSIPLSANKLQQRRYGVGVLDDGILSLFEIPTTDVSTFLAQLKITAKSPPNLPTGSPLENGWNVWPTNAQTFVPGNVSLSGLKKTWTGSAQPIEMLSCKSTKGDWLHVEVWAVEDHRLIKLYTDRN